MVLNFFEGCHISQVPDSPDLSRAFFVHQGKGINWSICSSSGIAVEPGI